MVYDLEESKIWQKQIKKEKEEEINEGSYKVSDEENELEFLYEESKEA